MPATDTHVPITAQPWRTGLTMLVFAGLFAYVAFRLQVLQIDESKRLAEMGERQRTRTWTIMAPRGGLYDADGSPLAVSAGTWNITADPVYMDDRLRATVELSRILDLSREDLRKEFELPRNGRTIARGITDDQATQVKTLKLGGVYVRREYTRRYPEGALAAHTLGFVLRDGKGGAGIEQVFDGDLAGTPGKEIVTVDALGKPSLTDAESIPAQGGAHVQLTISAPLQRILEEALMAQVAACKPLSASAVLVRPATGEVVAMASWPTFDPTDLSKLDVSALRNNVLTFPYEPGSTMKPLFAGAAVADRLTTFNEMINCEKGAWTYREGRAKRTIHEKTGGHGILSVTDGIALSDNILMAKLGVRMDPERMEEWMRLFGFGRTFGFTLPGEEPGMLPRAKKWTRINEGMSLPIGHGFMVTPLQLAMAHAAVANGGVWLPPRIVKRLWTVDGERERDLPLPATPEPRRIYTPDVAAALQEAMTHTLTEGTAKSAELDGYTAAGKTGTAEKVVNGRYSNGDNIGSFVCWAPAEPQMRPELLCLVVIDDPSIGKGFGSVVAAPVVQQVLQKSLEHLRVPKRPVAEPEKPRTSGTTTTPRTTPRIRR
ncbi:MAG: penicillin-binding protein 2 [Planctomycetes bacterium]|nr:penicillin-binding protein 2 [Planctomycetota bacterium]